MYVLYPSLAPPRVPLGLRLLTCVSAPSRGLSAGRSPHFADGLQVSVIYQSMANRNGHFSHVPNGVLMAL